MSIEIPNHLIKQIEQGNCVLFLGSGASFGALTALPEKIPLGQQLADMIAAEFLDDSYSGSPLSFVAELAISIVGLTELQRFIAKIFSKYAPADFHSIITSFVWKAIFTTNYDTIIESVYDKNSQIQELSVVVKDTRQQDVFTKANSLPYYKLHGCINYVTDDTIPLILTIDQYITHRDHRSRLFDRLKELANDFTFLFVGYGMADYNIRGILNEIEKSLEKRPRSYMVSPFIKDEEIKLWELKKISVIKCDFEKFLRKIDLDVSPQNRILSSLRNRVDHPIYAKFTVDPGTVKPSTEFLRLINEEADFLHSNFTTENTKAEAFYKGYFENWDPIARNLDVRRQLTDSIISEVVIEDGYHVTTPQNLFLIRGYAGSGKSVFIKRVAWDAANMFEKLCLYLKPGSKLSYDPISELYNYVKERIFLFVDGVAGRDEDIKRFLDNCKKDKIEITIICTERTNVWNTDCTLLESYLTQVYTLKYLENKEIDALLELLTRHNSLGLLEKKTKAEQRSALAEQANRELLVALYEATQGRPFEDIIKDEYEKISSESAKQMYLTICILHRLGASARAGLIARVHGINFEEFKEKLFKPLEFIVFDKRDYYINDYIYLTRHKQIADMVFETVLTTAQERFDQYAKILAYLNTDFESDRTACHAMTNARKLISIFSDPIMVRNLYNIAEENNIDNPKIKQQRAIYEMQSPGGSLFTAERYLNKALEISVNDPVILHSKAELFLKKAEKTDYLVEQNKFLSDASDICDRLIRKQLESSYPYHTLLKVFLFKIKREISKSDDIEIESLVKDFEKYLNIAKQKFPLDETLLGLEASLNEVFNDTPAAKEVLRKAYSINSASPFISIRYSELLQSEGDLPGAISALEKTAKLVPNDKDVNFKMAMLINQTDAENYAELKHYLRRSFTAGDNRYNAKFWFARNLYLSGEVPESLDKFEELFNNNKINYEIKSRIQGVVHYDGAPKRFKGIIRKIETTFGFIQREDNMSSIYFNPSENEDNWHLLKKDQKVSFEIGFTYRGPQAINLGSYR